MNLNETIKQYFTQELIVDMLTKYELYYQISLSSNIYDNLQDIDETINKIEELALEVDPNIAISNIIEIIVQYSLNENFETIFEHHLRSRALLHSLKDLLNSDNKLISDQQYISKKTNQILTDGYFNDSMKEQFDHEYPLVCEKYEMLITEQIVEDIRNNLN